MICMLYLVGTAEHTVSVSRIGLKKQIQYIDRVMCCGLSIGFNISQVLPPPNYKIIKFIFRLYKICVLPPFTSSGLFIYKSSNKSVAKL